MTTFRHKSEKKGNKQDEGVVCRGSLSGEVFQMQHTKFKVWGSKGGSSLPGRKERDRKTTHSVRRRRGLLSLWLRSDDWGNGQGHCPEQVGQFPGLPWEQEWSAIPPAGQKDLLMGRGLSPQKRTASVLGIKQSYRQKTLSAPPNKA